MGRQAGPSCFCAGCATTGVTVGSFRWLAKARCKTHRNERGPAQNRGRQPDRGGRFPGRGRERAPRGTGRAAGAKARGAGPPDSPAPRLRSRRTSRAPLCHGGGVARAGGRARVLREAAVQAGAARQEDRVDSVLLTSGVASGGARGPRSRGTRPRSPGRRGSMTMPLAAREPRSAAVRMGCWSEGRDRAAVMDSSRDESLRAFDPSSARFARELAAGAPGRTSARRRARCATGI